MKNTNRLNSIIVSEKVIKDTLEFIEVSEYDGLTTKKEVIKAMLESVETKENKGNIQLQVKTLVNGACFRFADYDILEFIKTLNLNEYTMKRADDEPLKIYADLLWHAIKRYLKGGFINEIE